MTTFEIEAGRLGISIEEYLDFVKDMETQPYGEYIPEEL